MRQAEPCERACRPRACRCRSMSACATGIPTCRHAGGDVARRHPPRGRIHRRRAAELLELHAVSGERRRGARARWRGGARRRRGRLRRATGTPIPGFVDGERRRTSATRSTRCRRSVRDRAEDLSPRTAFRCRWRERYPYQRQLEETARLVGASVNAEPLERSRDSALVYQSRSGRPEDPWLGPDVCDYLRDERREGLRPRCSSPIGFLCDHIEVLYDLDVEAAAVCREIGLPMVRAKSVNDHPRFADAMADAVMQTIERYVIGSAACRLSPARRNMEHHSRAPCLRSWSPAIFARPRRVPA